MSANCKPSSGGVGDRAREISCSQSIPPTHLSVVVESIPETLRLAVQWLVWKYEWRADKTGGKWTKVPYDPKTGKRARSNGPETWATSAAALRVHQGGGYAGIGFAFRDGDGLAGVDLDHVIDPDTSEALPWALEILEAFKGTYAEISPSGTGLRIFCIGKAIRCGKGTENKAVELYDHSSPRYLTVTGHHWPGSSPVITEQQPALDWLHSKYFAPKAKPNGTGKPKPDGFIPPAGDDGAIIEQALKARNGAKLRALLAGDANGYPSQSEADAALCSTLAFWTQDPAQMDRIFRGSGLMRDKWDTKHHADGRTYGEATIDHALQSVGKTYTETLREKAARVQGKVNAKTEARPNPATGDDSWPRLEWRPETCQDIGDTDMGNAQRIFDQGGRNMMFVREVGWHAWGGFRWMFNEAGAKRLADALPKWVLVEAAELLTKAAAEPDNRQRNALNDMASALQSWAKKCEKAATIDAALQMLERRLIVEPTEADADSFLLAVANGTLDLRTGQLRPSRRGDFITRGSDIRFDPAATCPTFIKFMERIFHAHPEVIPFLQRAIGYTLTGDTREQCVFIAHGDGSNGKSTLVKVLEWLLGDYARQAAPDLLLTKTGDRHPTEIADLRGARLVATVETGEGRRMAESLLKQMSGGDKLKGRYMRRDFFEFDPTFKVWLATNHKPAIRGTDHGIWRRIRLIPFEETIGDSEKDPALPAKLKAELPGIMAWAVRGCLEWQRDGLKPPDVVKAATDAYRAEQDVLAAFLDECCVVNRRAEARAADLYKAYTEWCERTGEYADKQRKFGESLTERGFERDKGTAGVRVYRGIGLLDSGVSGASGAVFPKTPIEGNFPDKPQNHATNATCATQTHPVCLSCVHWSDRCGAGLAVSDPSMERICWHFVVRTRADREVL